MRRAYALGSVIFPAVKTSPPQTSLSGDESRSMTASALSLIPSRTAAPNSSMAFSIGREYPSGHEVATRISENSGTAMPSLWAAEAFLSFISSSPRTPHPQDERNIEHAVLKKTSFL